MPKQPAFPGLRDAMKKKVTRREQFLAEMEAVVLALIAPHDPKAGLKGGRGPMVRCEFALAQRQREPNVEHHRQADDLWARLEVAERGALGHQTRLDGHPGPLKKSSSNNIRCPNPPAPARPPCCARART